MPTTLGEGKKESGNEYSVFYTALYLGIMISNRGTMLIGVYVVYIYIVCYYYCYYIRTTGAIRSTTTMFTCTIIVYRCTSNYKYRLFRSRARFATMTTTVTVIIIIIILLLLYPSYSYGR